MYNYNSLRDYLKSKLTPDYYDPNNDDHHERLAWAIGEYLGCVGLEWTADDVKVIEEYGDCPGDYLCFDEEQEAQIDEVYAAAEHLVAVLRTNFRTSDKPHDITLEEMQIAKELADIAADMLTERGYPTFFPTHCEEGDKEGKEWISDLYDKPRKEERHAG